MTKENTRTGKILFSLTASLSMPLRCEHLIGLIFSPQSLHPLACRRFFFLMYADEILFVKCNLLDVAGGIYITVVMRAAFRARPFPVG